MSRARQTLSALMVVIGVAIIVTTLARGGGPLAQGLLFGTLFVLAILSIVSLVLRFRRSTGIERRQMKLFVFAGVLVVAFPLIGETALEKVLPATDVLFAVAVAMPPVAIGVAVLRYRLYDIDRLISRSVTYGLLTAVLLGVYVGAVTALTAVTATAAGNSPIAVAAATLLAAAAFQPARRRIQAIVDRRFNRAAYDAARTMDDFRTQLRDEVDLVAIHDRVAGVLDSTVQPTHRTLWLRPVEHRQ